MVLVYGKVGTMNKCKKCGERVEEVDPIYGLCYYCKKENERAYDDYVDPLHWYHQHSPDRATDY